MRELCTIRTAAGLRRAPIMAVARLLRKMADRNLSVVMLRGLGWTWRVDLRGAIS